MIADARGVPVPNNDYLAALQSWISGAPMAPAPRIVIPEVLNSPPARARPRTACAILMVIVLTLLWAAVHFLIAGRTLRRDRVG